MPRKRRKRLTYRKGFHSDGRKNPAYLRRNVRQNNRIVPVDAGLSVEPDGDVEMVNDEVVSQHQYDEENSVADNVNLYPQVSIMLYPQENLDTMDSDFNNYQCPKCMWRTTMARSFRNHRRIHQLRNSDFNCAETNAEPYSCRCGYQNFFSSSMKKHITENHRQSSNSAKVPEVFKNYKCRKCYFESRSILCYYKHYGKCSSNSNLLEQKTSRRFECHQTEGKILMMLLMRKGRGRRDVTNVVWIGCDICEYKTKNKTYMKEHIKRKHSADRDAELFTCDYCDYKTKHKRDMKQHVLKKHTALKRIGCDMCEFKTKQKTYLKKHIKRKHTAKWIGCDKCEYKTTYKTYLKEHIKRKHSADRDAEWLCDYCDYKTHSSSYMKKHIRSHIAANWIKCDQCNFKTMHKSGMKSHIFSKHTPALKAMFAITKQASREN